MPHEQAIDEFLEIMDGMEAEYGTSFVAGERRGWGERRAVELLTALGIDSIVVQSRVANRKRQMGEEAARSDALYYAKHGETK